VDHLADKKIVLDDEDAWRVGPIVSHVIWRRRGARHLALPWVAPPYVIHLPAVYGSFATDMYGEPFRKWNAALRHSRPLKKIALERALLKKALLETAVPVLT
jgi:hypothetical protein